MASKKHKHTPQVAEAIDEIEAALIRLGFDTKTPSTEHTAERFVRYLQEFHQPFNPAEILGDGFEHPRDVGIHGMVVQTGIPFRAVCEHHLLPFTGEAAIGYVPGERVVGLSKLARIVQAFGTLRPSLQELITEQIVDALERHLSPRGVIVTITAEHGCMSCRGIAAGGVATTTSRVRGVFRDVSSAREEFFSILHNHHVRK